MRNGQGFSPVLFLQDAQGNPVAANGFAGIARAEIADPFEVGLSLKLEYFNIGSEFNAVMGSRREADVLLTDGMPTVSPPQGNVKAFEAYLEEHPAFERAFQLHAFGFGSGLDSKLLLDLASAGRGAFSFIPDAKIVLPGDPERSILYQRISRRLTGQMPPLMSTEVDREAVDLIAEWIRSLPPSE